MWQHVALYCIQTVQHDVPVSSVWLHTRTQRWGFQTALATSWAAQLKGTRFNFWKRNYNSGFFFFFFYKRLFSRENKKVAVLLGIKRKLKDLSVSDQNEFCKTTQCTFKINCPSVPICQTPLPPPLDPFDYNSTTTTSSLISGHLTTPKNTYLWNCQKQMLIKRYKKHI